MTEPINEGEEDSMGEEEIRGDLHQLLAALKENGHAQEVARADIYRKLEDVSRKQDNLPGMINDLERRQQKALEDMRRDFERLFVPRVEYDPKHQILLDKMAEYDRIIRESYASRDDYSNLKALVNRNTEEIASINKRNEGGLSRVTAIISIVVAIGTLIFSLAQHIILK